jgi:DNA-binding NtrC family response regulator
VPTLERDWRDAGLEDARSGVILLVDDEEVVRRSAGRLLKQAGHRVVFAGDGRQAVEIYKDSSPRPDVVLLDLDMPHMSGEESFRRLQELDPEVKVLFISGYWDDAREQALKALGACGFLQKPYDARRLRELIARALRRPAATEDGAKAG